MKKIKEFEQDRTGLLTTHIIPLFGCAVTLLLMVILCIIGNAIKLLLYIFFPIFDFIIQKNETIQYWIMFVPTLLGIGYVAIDPPAIILRNKEKMYQLLFPYWKK